MVGRACSGRCEVSLRGPLRGVRYEVSDTLAGRARRGGLQLVRSLDERTVVVPRGPRTALVTRCPSRGVWCASRGVWHLVTVPHRSRSSGEPMHARGPPGRPLPRQFKRTRRRLGNDGPQRSAMPATPGGEVGCAGPGCSLGFLASDANPLPHPRRLRRLRDPSRGGTGAPRGARRRGPGAGERRRDADRDGWTARSTRRYALMW